MADFSALKTSIQNYIKQNGNEEITGNLLQQILLSMVTTLGDSAINDLVTALNAEIANRGNADTELGNRITSEAEARAGADNTLRGLIDGITDNIENGYVYAGIATPSTTPASGKVFYLALTAGTYTNFGATVVSQGINILKYNGSAWSLDSFLGLDDAPTQGSNNLVKSGGVLDSIIKDGSAFDLSAYNNGTTYADLSAALTALNALPAAYKKGGMSMKYVQSSDNKYVQYRFVLSEFTSAQFIDITNWNNIDNPEIKLDKIFGDNLINPQKLEHNKAINSSGDIVTVGSDTYCISDYIPVNGNDIISNAFGIANTWQTYLVFDSNKIKLRAGGISKQYTYQEEDAFVRFSFKIITTTPFPCANYGTTLVEKEYTDYLPLQVLQDKVTENTVNIDIAENELETARESLRVNLLDGITITEGSLFNASGNITSNADYCITDYIAVHEKNIIANCFYYNNTWAGFVVYDKNKAKLRANTTTNQYTYQDGDYYVRFAYRLSNTKVAYFGTTLYNSNIYDDVAKNKSDIAHLKTVVTDLGTYKQYNIITVGTGKNFSSIQEAINSITDASFDNRYLIMVYDDQKATQISDLWLLRDPVSHATDDSAGCAYIITKDYVDILGATRPIKISVELPYAASSSNQYKNCHCILEKGSVQMANLVVESKYTRYTMHEENGGNSLSGVNANRRKYFKNIIFRYLAGESYNRALGIGTAPGEECVYENCTFESYNGNTVLDGIGNLHSHADYEYPFVYEFRNCKMTSADGITSPVYTDILSGVIPTFKFYNCDFGAILDKRSPTALGNPTLSSPARDFRKGGMYLIGSGNTGYLGTIAPPCMYLQSNDNNVDVNVINDGASNSAFMDIFGDPIVVYKGSADAKGLYLGSEYLLNVQSSAWSMGMRLGDCTTNNKVLVVSVGGVQQTITLNLDYRSLTRVQIINDINSKLSGCQVGWAFNYKIMHWGDNMSFVKNVGNTTISLGDIVSHSTSDLGIEKSQEGDNIYGVASERINPGEYGVVITKSKQRFRQVGGLATSIENGKMYKAGNNGTLVETQNVTDAYFVSVGNGLVEWK